MLHLWHVHLLMQRSGPQTQEDRNFMAKEFYASSIESWMDVMTS